MDATGMQTVCDHQVRAAPGGFSDVIYAQNARERCLKAPRTRGPPSEQLFDVIYGRNVIYGVRARREQLYQ
jgi:hypothetical protein